MKKIFEFISNIFEKKVENNQNEVLQSPIIKENKPPHITSVIKRIKADNLPLVSKNNS